MAATQKGSIEGRGGYFVSPETEIVYKIMSKDPIGRAKFNIPVYRVAYSVAPDDPSQKREFVSHEFLSAKRVTYYDSFSIKPFSRLRHELYINDALPMDHENLVPIYAHFVDTETEALCAVMPFADRGSLRSIMADKFKNGFPEICICLALESVVSALGFLHKASYLHGNVNAGHVYVKSGPKIMLGFAATVYEHGVSNVECTSSDYELPATHISTWAAAPEVYYAGLGLYSEKADIWLVGITALELAYGGIRVPNREALEMLIAEINDKKRLPKKLKVKERKAETEERREGDDKGKRIMGTAQRQEEESESEERTFSREFEKMVADCLAWEPVYRPSAHTLLKHGFFRNKEFNRSSLLSHFQAVVIRKIPWANTIENSSSQSARNYRRRGSHISIPGPASAAAKAAKPKPKLRFPSRKLRLRSVESHEEKVPLKLRFKRAKRALYNQKTGAEKPHWEITAATEGDQAKDSIPSFSTTLVKVEVSSFSSFCDQNDYLVESEFHVVYKIVSEHPIGISSDNIPVYRVAYSQCEDNPRERVFVDKDYLSAKIVNIRGNQEAYEELKYEVERRNRALPWDHENLMQVEASFADRDTLDFCVLMPFAEWGSLRSIMANHFPHGFPEICIPMALRPVLEALHFLHANQVFHGDISAGHVYLLRGKKGGGLNIKLGFAATVYEENWWNIECSNSSTLPETEITSWAAAPEVYNSAGNENLYTEKADIWHIGIMALELAYGVLRVPSREALEAMIREIIEKKRLPKKHPDAAEQQSEKDEEKGKNIMDIAEEEKAGSEERCFSRIFEKMVVECLAWNPGERPTALTLLNHKFFMECVTEKSKMDSHFMKMVIKRCKR